MTGWIVVCNWRKFQHYGNRRPAWIKLYPSLLHNTSYRELDVFHRALLVDIWLAYAASGCELRASPAALARRLGYPTEHEVEKRRKLAINSPPSSHHLATELATNSPAEQDDDGERPIRSRDLKRLVQAGFIEIHSEPLLAHVRPVLAPTRARATERKKEEKNVELKDDVRKTSSYVARDPVENLDDEELFDFEKINYSPREMP